MTLFFHIFVFVFAPWWPQTGPRTVDFCPSRAAVAMGDNVSKRLKLISATEAEMEERTFPNPYPDWEQGVLTPTSGADVDYNEPFDADGKVRTLLSWRSLHFTLLLMKQRASLAHSFTYVALTSLCLKYVYYSSYIPSVFWEASGKEGQLSRTQFSLNAKCKQTLFWLLRLFRQHLNYQFASLRCLSLTLTATPVSSTLTQIGSVSQVEWKACSLINWHLC